MKATIITGALLIACQFVSAQFNDSLLMHERILLKEDSGRFVMNLHTAGFLRNIEYFNSRAEGITWMGTRFLPSLTWQPTSGFAVTAGAFCQFYSGYDEKGSISPWLSLEYRFAKKWQLTLGSYMGSLSHGLIEPLYSYDRFIQYPNEQGIRIKGTGRRISADVWINWEKFILPGDNYKEEFVGGASGAILLTQPEKNFRIDIPMQGMVIHKGGQTESSTENMQTTYNSATGIRTRISKIGNWKNLGAEFWFAGFADASPVKSMHYSKGYGLYSLLTGTYKKFTFSTGYWLSEHFIALRGESMYQSVSTKYVMWWDKKPSILTLKISFQQKIGEGISMDIRSEGYYDTNTGITDYSYSLYLIMNERFFLNKKKS